MPKRKRLSWGDEAPPKRPPTRGEHSLYGETERARKYLRDYPGRVSYTGTSQTNDDLRRMLAPAIPFRHSQHVAGGRRVGAEVVDPDTQVFMTEMEEKEKTGVAEIEYTPEYVKQLGIRQAEYSIRTKIVVDDEQAVQMAPVLGNIEDDDEEKFMLSFMKMYLGEFEFPKGDNFVGDAGLIAVPYIKNMKWLVKRKPTHRFQPINPNLDSEAGLLSAGHTWKSTLVHNFALYSEAVDMSPFQKFIDELQDDIHLTFKEDPYNKKEFNARSATLPANDDKKFFLLTSSNTQEQFYEKEFEIESNTTDQSRKERIYRRHRGLDYNLGAEDLVSDVKFTVISSKEEDTGTYDVQRGPRMEDFIEQKPLGIFLPDSSLHIWSIYHMTNTYKEYVPTPTDGEEAEPQEFDANDFVGLPWVDAGFLIELTIEWIATYFTPVAYRNNELFDGKNLQPLTYNGTLKYPGSTYDDAVVVGPSSLNKSQKGYKLGKTLSHSKDPDADYHFLHLGSHEGDMVKHRDHVECLYANRIKNNSPSPLYGFPRQKIPHYQDQMRIFQSLKKDSQGNPINMDRFKRERAQDLNRRLEVDMTRRAEEYSKRHPLVCVIDGGVRITPGFKQIPAKSVLTQAKKTSNTVGIMTRSTPLASQLARVLKTRTKYVDENGVTQDEETSIGLVLPNFSQYGSSTTGDMDTVDTINIITPYTPLPSLMFGNLTTTGGGTIPLDGMVVNVNAPGHAPLYRTGLVTTGPPSSGGGGGGGGGNTQAPVKFGFDKGLTQVVGFKLGSSVGKVELASTWAVIANTIGLDISVRSRVDMVITSANNFTSTKYRLDGDIFWTDTYSQRWWTMSQDFTADFYILDKVDSSVSVEKYGTNAVSAVRNIPNATGVGVELHYMMGMGNTPDPMPEPSDGESYNRVYPPAGIRFIKGLKFRIKWEELISEPSNPPSGTPKSERGIFKIEGQVLEKGEMVLNPVLWFNKLEGVENKSFQLDFNATEIANEPGTLPSNTGGTMGFQKCGYAMKDTSACESSTSTAYNEHYFSGCHQSHGVPGVVGGVVDQGIKNTGARRYYAVDGIWNFWYQRPSEALTTRNMDDPPFDLLGWFNAAGTGVGTSVATGPSIPARAVPAGSGISKLTTAIPQEWLVVKPPPLSAPQNFAYLTQVGRVFYPAGQQFGAAAYTASSLHDGTKVDYIQSTAKNATDGYYYLNSSTVTEDTTTPNGWNVKTDFKWKVFNSNGIPSTATNVVFPYAKTTTGNGNNMTRFTTTVPQWVPESGELGMDRDFYDIDWCPAGGITRHNYWDDFSTWKPDPANEHKSAIPVLDTPLASETPIEIGPSLDGLAKMLPKIIDTKGIPKADPREVYDGPYCILRYTSGGSADDWYNTNKGSITLEETVALMIPALFGAEATKPAGTPMNFVAGDLASDALDMEPMFSGSATVPLHRAKGTPLFTGDFWDALAD